MFYKIVTRRKNAKQLAQAVRLLLQKMEIKAKEYVGQENGGPDVIFTEMGSLESIVQPAKVIVVVGDVEKSSLQILRNMKRLKALTQLAIMPISPESSEEELSRTKIILSLAV